jgi:hypothetical protein
MMRLISNPRNLETHKWTVQNGTPAPCYTLYLKIKVTLSGCVGGGGGGLDSLHVSKVRGRDWVGGVLEVSTLTQNGTYTLKTKTPVSQINTQTDSEIDRHITHKPTAKY